MRGLVAAVIVAGCVIASLTMIAMIAMVTVVMRAMGLVEDLGVLPIVALTGDGHQEETGGEAVECFHARQV